MSTIFKPEEIAKTFAELLNQQTFVQQELDYSVMEKHAPLLQMLANVGNTGISVFDICKKEHVFYSPNFGKLLGYDLSEMNDKGHAFFDEKIHPDDFISLTMNGIMLFKLFAEFTLNEKAEYKLINDYRILNAENCYVRVIEQHQILEFDRRGNMWLTLSIVDISPNQNINEGVISQLLNFRTGRIIPLGEQVKQAEIGTISLSKREIQILRMVRDGLLSKEISSNLDISLHTVNTHRQKVLEKLGANNSMEAVAFASKLGLL